MISFKRVELEDRDKMNEYLHRQFNRSCEDTFANIFLWSRYYEAEYAIVANTMVVKTGSGEDTSFAFPMGYRDDVKAALDVLMVECDETGLEFQMHCITEEEFGDVEKWYPDTFQIQYIREDADYVYEREKLANLSGKKYHGKKNHVNKFKNLFPDWSYERITDENMEDCFQMAMNWRKDNEVEEEEEKTAEMGVTMNALRLYKELDLTGGLLRVKGKVVAFTLGEPVSEDTFVVHIEKADTNYHGAYTMINQQFVIHETEGYQYINREEDTGAEGLRQAKLSYRPVFMVEKGYVTKK